MSEPQATSLRRRLRALFGSELVRRIASGSIWSLVIKLASAALTFAMLATLARVMSLVEFGRFGFAFSLASFLAVAANPGLHTAIMRWIPEYEARGMQDTARQALRWSSLVAVTCGVAMAALMALTVNILPLPGAKQYLYLASVFILPFLLAEYLGSILRAKGSVFWAQLPRDVIWRLGVLVLVIAFLLNGQTLTASEAIGLVALGLALALVPQIFRIWPLHKAEGEKFFPPKHISRELRGQLLPYWGPSTIYAATQYIDTVLVGTFVSTDDAGAYFAAARIAALASLTLAATNMISAPLIARAYHSNDLLGLKRTLRTVAFCISVPTALVVVGITASGSWLLSIFDPTYTTIFPVLVILLIGHAVNGFCGPASYLLQMTGYGHEGFKIIAFSYALGLAVQLVLVQSLGTIGAAIGGACTMAGWSLASRGMAIRKLGVDPSASSLFGNRIIEVES